MTSFPGPHRLGPGNEANEQPEAWPGSQVLTVSGLGTRLMSSLKHGLVPRSSPSRARERSRLMSSLQHSLVPRYSVIAERLGTRLLAVVWLVDLYGCWYRQHLLDLLFEILTVCNIRMG